MTTPVDPQTAEEMASRAPKDANVTFDASGTHIHLPVVSAAQMTTATRAFYVVFVVYMGLIIGNVMLMTDDQFSVILFLFTFVLGLVSFWLSHRWAQSNIQRITISAHHVSFAGCDVPLRGLAIEDYPKGRAFLVLALGSESWRINYTFNTSRSKAENERPTIQWLHDAILFAQRTESQVGS